jgi:hypothetical protein
MSTAHTPGPWKVYRTTDGTAILGVGDADSGGISDANFGLWRSGEEREANARLIAAAPELLDMLKRVLRASPVFERDCLYGEACEFVAKAEGRS